MDDTVVPEDQDSALDEDVEGHGLLRNAAVAAALTVGGGAALASPASAGPLDVTYTNIEAVVDDGLASQVATALTARYDLSVPPEMLTMVLSDGAPMDVKTVGAESVATYLVETFGGTDGLVAAIEHRTATERTLASQVATLLTAFDLSVPPEKLTMVLDGVPTDVKTAGAESVVTFLEKTYGGTEELVTELRTAIA